MFALLCLNFWSLDDDWRILWILPCLLLIVVVCIAAPEVGDSPRSPRVSPILGCDQDELQVAEEPAAMETGNVNATNNDSDPFKSEGLISYHMSNMTEFASSMSSQRLSPAVSIRDLPWCVTETPVRNCLQLSYCTGSFLTRTWNGGFWNSSLSMMSMTTKRFGCRDLLQLLDSVTAEEGLRDLNIFMSLT